MGKLLKIVNLLFILQQSVFISRIVESVDIKKNKLHLKKMCCRKKSHLKTSNLYGVSMTGEKLRGKDRASTLNIRFMTKECFFSIQL